MIDIEPNRPMGVFEYVSVVHSIQDMFPIRADVADRAQLKPHVRPSAEREAIYAF
jgi:predicted nucleotidyltransferase